MGKAKGWQWDPLTYLQDVKNRGPDMGNGPFYNPFDCMNPRLVKWVEEREEEKICSFLSGSGSTVRTNIHLKKIKKTLYKHTSDDEKCKIS